MKIQRVLLLLFANVMWFSSHAQLYYTPQEVAIWKQRSLNGPYKTTGDVSANSPGDWERILANANKLVASPLSDFYKGPEFLGDGKTRITGLIVQYAVPEAREKGSLIRDAAFVYLLTKEVKYLDAVKIALLAEAREPNLDFSNRSKWTNNLGDINPGFSAAEWCTRLLIAYDFLGISDPVLDNWFKNAATYFQFNVETGLNNYFSNRDAGVIKDMVYQSKISSKTTHLNGNAIPVMALHYNNRRGAFYRYIAIAAVKYKNDSFKHSAKRFFKEWMKYSVFPDGSCGEFERSTTTLPDLGYGYATSVVSEMVQIADVFARAGDDELYRHTTSEGIATTIGGPKNLKLVVKYLFDLINQVTVRYVINTTDQDNKIDGVCNRCNWYSANDVWFSQSNVYYKEDYFTRSYTRKVPTSKAYPINPASAGPTPVWNMSGALYPGALFMFGQMEGKVNPYATTVPAPVVIDITADVLKKIDDLTAKGSALKAEFNKQVDALNAEVSNLKSTIAPYKVTKTQ